MATTLLTATKALGSFEDTLTALVMNASDVVNQNHFVATGNDLVIIHNTHAGIKTVTITSVANKWGRSGTLTAIDVPIGGYCIFGPMVVAGWASDGIILIEGSDVLVKIGIVNL